MIGNDSLENLDGLSGITEFVPTYFDELWIEQNASLPTCAAEEFRDLIVSAGWTGDESICENLEDACGSEPCP